MNGNIGAPTEEEWRDLGRPKDDTAKPILNPPLKKVYIAHPLRGRTVAENMSAATAICQQLAATGTVIPMSPLHAFSFLDPEKCDINQVMQYCFALLVSCDELWVHGKWWTSEGCQTEMCFAACRGIPIRFK